LFVDNTVYCYSAMLATFLAGLGLGGYVWSRFLNWEGRLPFRLAVLQLLLGSYGTLTVVLFHHLDRMGFPQRLFMKGDSALAFSLPYFGATVPVLLIPTFLMGLSFPLIVKILISDTHLLGRRLGQAYAVNTLGAIAGSLVAGFVLLPAVGIQKSIVGGGGPERGDRGDSCVRGRPSLPTQREIVLLGWDRGPSWSWRFGV
jgi:spermidine synthase